MQKHLAAAMSEWGGYYRGRSPPPLPWTDGRFLAFPPIGFLLNLALVVDGTVQAADGVTQVTALIRPHGSEALSLFILSAFFLGAVPWEGAPALALFPLAFLWMWAAFQLWLNVTEKSPAFEDACAAALRQLRRPVSRG